MYLYNQNSSTPVNSYSDTALSVLNPWPLEADSSGMCPQFWLADGSYRVRATSNDGAIVLYDLPSVLAIGASTGSAPSGGVDPAAIFQTGDVIWVDFQGTRAGWVRDNMRSIGSAISGASERANADCQALFIYMWNNFVDPICGVSGGRGASGLADWNANKTITMPDRRGYIVGGLDDMGNAAAGRWSNVFNLFGPATMAGSLWGDALNSLTSQLQLPNCTFNVAIPSGQGSHTHTVSSGVGLASGTNIQQPGGGALTTTNVIIAANTLPSMTGTAPSGGLGQQFAVVQRTVLGTFYRKL